MYDPFDHPLAVFAATFAAQCLAAFLGHFLRARAVSAGRAAPVEFGTILPAALTLLALIISFSFSMAVSRYDQRKNYEEAEANAIGTEYVRADLLPAAQAARTRELLVSYTEQRILFYRSRDEERLSQINTKTAALQNELWAGVAGPATAQPTPVVALAVAGMNDVLNSEGYTQAAWWNRIPPGTWLLMELVAIACNLLLGFGEQHVARPTLLIMPLLVAVPLFLIADIDSPRGGVIHVAPQNLMALYQSLTGH